MPVSRVTGSRLAHVAGALAGVALAAACTAGRVPGPGPAVGPPPAPPAACLLDPAALATGTGMTWSPDLATASDVRCVYDPGSGTPGGVDFIAVDLATDLFATDLATTDHAPTGPPEAATVLDTLAELCADRSRIPVPYGPPGFVCRTQGGSVFAAAISGGRVMTVAASAVPDGTTADRMASTFADQLARFD